MDNEKCNCNCNGEDCKCSSEIKRCPFRFDEKGEFGLCYGDSCMAYYEYDAPVYSTKTGTSILTTKRLCSCHMLHAYYTCGGCT